jgi:class 3 adenylate cyclase
MSFRSKVFCSVVVPATVLVLLISWAGYRLVSSRAEEQAVDAARRARLAFDMQLVREFAHLRRLAAPFKGARFTATLEGALEGDLTLEGFAAEVEAFQGVALNRPPLCTWADRNGRIILRQVLREDDQYNNHVCTKECRHPESVFLEGEQGDGLIVTPELGLVAGSVEDLGAGQVFVANPIPVELTAIARTSGVELAVLMKGAVVFSTLPDVTPAMLARPEVSIGGGVYRVQPLPMRDGVTVLVPLVDLSFRERMGASIERGAKLGVALAFVAALCVAGVVARAMSRPVLELEAASRKVGEGDLSVQVEVRTKDELGRLGGTFNEMVRGLKKRTEIMQKTLSAEVERKMMADGELKLGGRKQVATILFMDVRGFTSLTEGMDPAKAVELVNQTMTRVERCIRRRHGMVNKYMGDGLMAIFGAPESHGNDALNAVEAARELQAEIKRWSQERRARGEPPVQVGVGINTDEILAGYVGSEDRLEFSAIGEGTNLASRLCAKAERGQILISQTTHRDAGVEGRELEPIHVKGFSVPIRVYEV